MGKTQFRINVSFLEKAGKDKVKLHKLEEIHTSAFLAISSKGNFGFCFGMVCSDGGIRLGP